MWPHEHPLRQFESVPTLALGQDLLSRLEDRGLTVERLCDATAGEIAAMLRLHQSSGERVRAALRCFPHLELRASLSPITRTVLRVQLELEAAFEWLDRAHGAALRWWVWVEDAASEALLHAETWTLTKKMAREGPQRLAFTVPIHEPLPPQYYVRVVSDAWLGAEAFLELPLSRLSLPERAAPHTELLDLDPLPLSALRNPAAEALYAPRFSHFNPVQTQAFHTLYHTDEHVLLGAPTGSGKTVVAELAMLRAFASRGPGAKVVYVAPLKALVRERVADWSRGFCARLGKKLAELTGDHTPDARALLSADLIVTTPEKWDGVSRNWQTRPYVRRVALVVIDEIHLLGADRGPVLEVIVSRMRYVAAAAAAAANASDGSSSNIRNHVRFVRLSTALANAGDVAAWLGVGPRGLFNFKPSVRPPGKFYCPRMASMNKPAYTAIQVSGTQNPQGGEDPPKSSAECGWAVTVCVSRAASPVATLRR